MSSCVAIGGLEAVLWEWPAFSGCPCGSGQPLVGVLVGVASLQQVSMAKRSGGRELGKGEGQAMSVGFSRIQQD